MNDMAAERRVNPDRDEQFCRFCGSPVPECAELITEHGEPNKQGSVMCMATGNDFTIEEWRDDG